MGKLFRRGLLATLPIAITVWLLYFVISFLYDNIGRWLGKGLGRIWEFVFGSSLTTTQATLLGFLLAVVAIFFIGLFFATFLGRRLYRLFEWLLQRIPLIGKIYPYAKQVTEYFASGEKKFEFKNAVAVPFPSPGRWMIGFMTNEGLRHLNEVVRVKTVAVFVPTSPTPFTGFVVFLPREDIIPLPLSVEEALRIVISCGILMPPQHMATEIRIGAPGAYPLPPEPPA